MVEVTRFELATPSSRTMCATKLRYTSKKIAPIYIEAVWLRNRDSNPNKQSQSLSCYRYTIPQNLLHLVCNVNYYTVNLWICQYLFCSILNFFPNTNILTQEIQLLGGAVDSGDKTVGVGFFQLRHVEVGADDDRLML